MLDGTGFTPSGVSDISEEFTPGVARLGIAIVNAYMVGAPGSPWTLVDTGLPRTATLTRWAATGRYGAGARPEAIVLTHGHFDHAGAALELASEWDVPIYVHPLEMPYLTGKSDYPPQDPSMGGAIAQLARVFPHGGYDFSDRIQPLPKDGEVPGAEHWRWIHTPGHTPGHVSLFRDSDGTLLAGDALATMEMDSWTSQLTRKRELSRPPAPFTPDWKAAHKSVEMLADLEPVAVAAGHGLPIEGSHVAEELRDFAGRFAPPPSGRYVDQPARADGEGVKELPPSVPDPLPKSILQAATVVVGAVGVALAWRLLQRRK